MGILDKVLNPESEKPDPEEVDQWTEIRISTLWENQTKVQAKTAADSNQPNKFLVGYLDRGVGMDRWVIVANTPRGQRRYFIDPTTVSTIIVER